MIKCNKTNTSYILYTIVGEKNIVLEICDFCEEVQANLYCYYQDENSYMIICIKYEKFKYYLTYPKFNIEQINNPNFDLVIKLVQIDKYYCLSQNL